MQRKEKIYEPSLLIWEDIQFNETIRFSLLCPIQNQTIDLNCREEKQEEIGYNPYRFDCRTNNERLKKEKKLDERNQNGRNIHLPIVFKQAPRIHFVCSKSITH